MFYSRVSEALFLFIRLLLAGFVAFGTCPSKTAVGGIIKKCGIIKRFNLSNWNLSLAITLIIQNSLCTDPQYINCFG